MELKLASLSASDSASGPFNQTRMELKLVKGDGIKQSILLLIRPEWNWNYWRIKRNIQQYPLLIRPEWNWNSLMLAAEAIPFELLIRPEWNWNKPSLLPNMSIWLSFNQTRMELKLWNMQMEWFWKVSFNQTRMELKQSRRNFIPCWWQSFNQTRMELKRWIYRH